MRARTERRTYRTVENYTVLRTHGPVTGDYPGGMEVSFEIPEGILATLLDGVPVPAMSCIRYRQSTPSALTDVGARIRSEMQNAGDGVAFRPGERIAVAVGSRGIARLPEIVAAVVAEIKACGATPFIVPAMGSHGGATAEGQQEVLTRLGVTEEVAGAPIRSQMDTVRLGKTAEGATVYLDRLAAGADGIVPIVRIKPHTAFRGPYESGVAKMLAIGLGKQSGAASTHARGFGAMSRMVPAMAEIVLARSRVVMAVAVLENARDEPFKLVILPASRIMQEEPGLLDEARAAMPRLPFNRFDILVIDRIGKNISGDGADPNVTGRYPTPDASGGPLVNKQVVLDLDTASAGNANGLGTADFTTIRAARRVSLAATYPNALTSTVPGPVKIPMILPSDRRAFQAAILTCNTIGRAPRMVRIRDTLHLETMWVSQALLEEAEANPEIEFEGGPEEVEFTADGNLPDLACP